MFRIERSYYIGSWPVAILRFLSSHSILRFIVGRTTILIAALISRNGWAVSITGNAISVVINSFSKLIVIIDRFGGSNGINTDLVPFATSNLAKFELRRKDRKPLRWNGILDLFYLKVANLVSFRLLVRRGADGIRRE